MVAIFGPAPATVMLSEHQVYFEIAIVLFYNPALATL